MLTDLFRFITSFRTYKAVWRCVVCVLFHPASDKTNCGYVGTCKCGRTWFRVQGPRH